MRRIPIWLVSAVLAAVAAAPVRAQPEPRAAQAAMAAGAPVVVAVVDSGVQADHPALVSRVLPGWNLIAGSGDTADDDGHGTAVAGIITAAESASGIPNACSQCRILPVKVLGPYAAGDWGTVAAGIVWAADHGANVVNLSLGAAHVPDDVAAAVEYAVSKGVIVVAAAGNDGRDEGFYPADYPGVVSVAGVDGGTARYPWSNFGGQVTVAAPGCATAPWLGGAYRPDFCGTSAAAPYVSGLAALALSYRPGLTPAQFDAALASSGAPLADPATAVDGLVDAGRLLTAVGVPTAPPTVTRPPALASAPLVGHAIAGTPGSWQNASSFSYEWQRSQGGSGWQTVSTGSAYTPRAGDRGHRLRLVVDALNVRGSATVTSAPSALVGLPASKREDARRQHARRHGSH